MRANVILAEDLEPTHEKTAMREPATVIEYGGDLFTSEEMQAIRDQYEERIAAEQARREELEWKVRMALAQVRDAELDARRAADQIRQIHLGLQALVAADPAQAPAPAKVQPAPRPQPAPPPRHASPVVAKLGPPPLPLPAKANNRRGPLPPRELNGYKRLA